MPYYKFECGFDASCETDYEEIAESIKNGNEKDIITLDMDGNGGLVHLGVLIMEAVDDTDAEIITRIDQWAGSMNAIVAMSGHSLSIHRDARIFFHSISGSGFLMPEETKKLHKPFRKLFTDFEWFRVHTLSGLSFTGHELYEKFKEQGHTVETLTDPLITDKVFYSFDLTDDPMQGEVNTSYDGLLKLWMYARNATVGLFSLLVKGIRHLIKR